MGGYRRYFESGGQQDRGSWEGTHNKVVETRQLACGHSWPVVVRQWNALKRNWENVTLPSSCGNCQQKAANSKRQNE